MVIMVEPDHGIPLAEEVEDIDLRERIGAAAQTASLLAEHGYDLDPTADDIAAVNDLAASFAEDPTTTSKEVTHREASKLSPAAIIATKAVLDEFGHAVAKDAVKIRHLVTNKLILETENADPRIRIRAAELLGKMSDVALFTERSEVTITHQSTDDLRAKLREKFERIREGAIATKKNAIGVYEPTGGDADDDDGNGDEFDLNAELGFDDDD